ncbi:MAG: sigma-70 family RNA polymerase sigma factor [Fusobacteriaceae bacterium]
MEKDLVSLYLDDIKKYKLLTREEEVVLLEKAQLGDKEAKQELILKNLRLVVNVAKKYSIRGMSLIDLVSEGNIGLIYAIDKFNLDKGTRFSTYAVWWIKQSISKALINKGRDIRIPSYKHDLISKINKKMINGFLNNGQVANIEEVARELSMSTVQIEKVMLEFQETVSLNTTISEDIYLQDTINFSDGSNLEDEILERMHRRKTKEMLEHLSLREKQILTWRYGLDGCEIQTLDQIGKIFNITRERVRQIEKKTLQKLKTKYGEQRV